MKKLSQDELKEFILEKGGGEQAIAEYKSWDRMNKRFAYMFINTFIFYMVLLWTGNIQIEPTFQMVGFLFLYTLCVSVFTNTIRIVKLRLIDKTDHERVIKEIVLGDNGFIDSLKTLLYLFLTITVIRYFGCYMSGVEYVYDYQYPHILVVVSAVCYMIMRTAINLISFSIDLKNDLDVEDE